METAVKKNMNPQIDELEVAILQADNLFDCPLDHIFTPGLYSRTIAMPATGLITSLYHKEEHQYIVSQGSALVKIGEDQWQRICAPFRGVTLAGTRRVLYIEEDCIWTTIHATNVYPEDHSEAAFLKAIEMVEDQIFEKVENPLLGGRVKNNIIIKSLNNKSCQE